MSRCQNRCRCCRARAVRLVRCGCRCLAGQFFQLLAADDNQWFGCRKNPAHAVRPVRCAVPFAGQRAVQFPNSRRVENAGIDFHHVVIELRGERHETTLNESAVVNRQIDAVE